MAKDVRRSTMESIMTQGSQDQELVSQWEVIMRRFSADCKVNQCRYQDSGSKLLDMEEKEVRRQYYVDTLEISREKKPLRRFVTGSTYDGTWDAFSMSGHGVYTFPNGVIYEGNFHDGDFHGEGELRYPNGIKVVGTWSHGKIKYRTVVFEDGVKYQEADWKYCSKNDRRYAVEYSKGIKGAEAKDRYLTADQPTKDIPKGCFDTCDGIYDPNAGLVFAYDDPTKLIRAIGGKQHEWIVRNCRTNPDTFGPCPVLYKGQPDPELLRPETPPPPALPIPSKSIESISLDSLEKESEIGTVWAKMVNDAKKSSKGWTKRVIQFDPNNMNDTE